MSTGTAIKAGEAFIELVLKDQRMQRGLRGAIRSMGKLAVAAAKVGAALAIALGGAALLTVKRSVVAFAAFGDHMEKMSQRTGISAKSLSELKFAAEQSGTTIDSFSQAIFRATRRIGNAATETGPAVRALKELRLNAVQLARQQPEVQFETLVNALAAMENPARRSQLAFEVFGDNWRQIAPLINAGTGSIAKFREEAQLLGNTLTDRQAANAANLTDAMNRLKTATQGFKTALGASLAPAFTLMLNDMTEFLVKWRQWLNQMVDDLRTAMRSIVTVFESQFNKLGRALRLGNLGADAKTALEILEKADRFAQSMQSAASHKVFTGLQQQAAGSSLGSFRGEAQVFGARGGTRTEKQLREMTDIQREQLEIMRQSQDNTPRF